MQLGSLRTGLVRAQRFGRAAAPGLQRKFGGGGFEDRVNLNTIPPLPPGQPGYTQASQIFPIAARAASIKRETGTNVRVLAQNAGPFTPYPGPSTLCPIFATMAIQVYYAGQWHTVTAFNTPAQTGASAILGADTLGSAGSVSGLGVLNSVGFLPWRLVGWAGLLDEATFLAADKSYLLSIAIVTDSPGRTGPPETITVPTPTGTINAAGYELAWEEDDQYLRYYTDAELPLLMAA